MDIFRRRENGNFAMGVSGTDDRKFPIKGNPFLEDRTTGRADQVICRSSWIDHLLAFAVISEVCALENGGSAYRLQVSVEFSSIRDNGKRCVGVAMCAQEVFFPLSVLADMKDLGPGGHRFRSRNPVDDLCRDIFKFESHHVDRLDERLEEIPV